jgi:hypothetical protein
MTFFLHKANGVQSTGGFWSFGLTTSGSVSEAAAETAWSGAVNTFFTGTVGTSYYSTGTELTQTSTSTASDTFRQTTKTVTTHTTAGGSGDPMLPEFCSVILSLYSASATRYGHGRWYLPSPSIGILASDTSGHIDSTAQTDFATALTTLFSSLSTAGLSPVLVTRRPTVTGAAQYSTRAIVRGSVPNQLEVQHRRGDKIVPTRVAVTT